ncbi:MULTISPECIES: glycosyltransferase [Sediminibacillus]|uniref:glycosyltransferase family protein n=1 Tax=Sediminibacillus TaxID=482460 RepID=UPI0012976F26|nr:glycosyltransferase [Sediminibacillus terrae]
MEQKLKILILVRQFWLDFPKHKPKIDMLRAIEEFAEVNYWHEDGNIHEILGALQWKPDFIFHYDIAWDNGLAPVITGLADIDIPKACFVIDLHFSKTKRIQYIEKNKVDLIFSVSKNPFLTVFPQYKDKLCWLPWSINPDIIKDWKMKKDIDYLLMGLLYYEDERNPPRQLAAKGRYAFREAVLNTMKDVPGFVFHPHPGHKVPYSAEMYINEKYARELNRAKIFFTCGSRNSSGAFAVLKYFEVLGCKTLLLAEPNQEITELGFQDGVHYVACNTNEIYEKALYYVNNEEQRNQIVQNGYDFIHQNHTNEMRAKQFVTYLTNYLNKI